MTMRRNDRILRIAGLFFMIFLFGAAGVLASQQVEVTVEVEEDTDTMTAKGMALEKAFTEAALSTSQDILPGVLSEERLALLKEYLGPRTDELVLSYKELDYEQTFTELKLVLDVRINRSLLKEYLKGIGIFYTSLEPWSYGLTLSGGEPADWMVLQDLQLLSGLQVRQTADPSLHLRHTSSGMWQAELTTNGQFISEYDQDLKLLWSRVWEEYFSLPEVQARVLQLSELRVEGWPNTDSLHSFNDELQNWDSIVEEATLKKIDLQMDSVSASWRIRARDLDVLRQNLEEYFGSRGLIYELSPEVVEKEEPEETEDKGLFG